MGRKSYETENQTPNQRGMKSNSLPRINKDGPRDYSKPSVPPGLEPEWWFMAEYFVHVCEKNKLRHPSPFAVYHFLVTHAAFSMADFQEAVGVFMDEMMYENSITAFDFIQEHMFSACMGSVMTRKYFTRLKPQLYPVDSKPDPGPREGRKWNRRTHL